MSQKEKSDNIQISSGESVARILSKEWFVRDKLLSTAFALEQGETFAFLLTPKSFETNILAGFSGSKGTKGLKGSKN